MTSVTKAPELNILLAVKGKANNIDLLALINSFDAAKTKITNPRSKDRLLKALTSGEYDLIICDDQFMTIQIVNKIERIAKGNRKPNIIIFDQTQDKSKSKKRDSVPTLCTFTMEDYTIDQLQNLLHLSLKNTLNEKKLKSEHNSINLENSNEDLFSYRGRIDSKNKFKIIELSDSFYTITGYKSDDFIKRRSWKSLIHKEDISIIDNFFIDVTKNKKSSATYRIKTKNQSLIWLESTGIVSHTDNKNGIIEIKGITKEITQEKTLADNLNAVSKIIQLASDKSTSPTSLIEIATTITQTLAAQTTEIYTVNQENSELILSASSDKKFKSPKKINLEKLDKNEIVYALSSKKMIIFDDIDNEKRFTPSPNLKKTKTQLGFFASLWNDHSKVGLLCIYSSLQRLQEHQLQFIETVIAILPPIISRHISHSTLVEIRQALTGDQLDFDSETSQYKISDNIIPNINDESAVIVTAAKDLRKRELILAAISKATTILIDIRNWQQNINLALEKLGNATGVSRVYIFQKYVDLVGDQLISISAEWTKHSVKSYSAQADLNTLSLHNNGLSNIESLLSKGEIVSGPITKFSKAEKDYFKRFKIKSLVLIPIFLDQKWWGFLGFDDCEHSRIWPAAEIDALSIAASTISSAIERKQHEATLQTILESSARKTGEDYFKSLLSHLINIFNADYCLIAESASENNFRIRNAIQKNEFLSPFEYTQNIDSKNMNENEGILYHESKAHKKIPENSWLEKNKIEGYIAIIIQDPFKKILGHIGVMSRKKLSTNPYDLRILKIFAARVGVELDRQSMESENRQLARISLKNPNMIMASDLDGNIIFYNPACLDMQKKLNLTHKEKLLPENHKALIAETLENINQKVTTERSFSEYSFQWNYYLQKDLNRIYIYAIDLTEYRKIEKQLRKDAFQDTLTNLPNRNFFNKLLTHAIERTLRRDDYAFAVLFLDLDRFKYINDSLGHAYGDKFLEIVANLLKNCLRPGDYIARLGGDEFAILLDSVTNTAEATNVAERIQNTLSKPILLDQHETFTSASIGIALSNLGYTRPEDILRDADIAMYSAKQSGKAKYTVFDSRMHADMVHVLRLETDLRNAIKGNELSVYYQPIYSLKEKRLSGFEALVRWQHPEKGFLEPDDFVPLAEEMSIIREIDYLVLSNASKQLKTWQKKYDSAKNIKMSVNLSAIHFNNTAILAEIGNVLKDNKLSNDCLQLELTEGVIMSHTSRSAEIFNVLNKLGLNISIDDFGVGYSSLSRLTQLPVDRLKIDKGFIQSMIMDASSLNITRAIIDLAHDLNMEVIAEGVETQGQLQILDRMGCQYVQGYYISKPLTQDETEAFLQSPPKL